MGNFPAIVHWIGGSAACLAGISLGAVYWSKFKRIQRARRELKTYAHASPPTTVFEAFYYLCWAVPVTIGFAHLLSASDTGLLVRSDGQEVYELKLIVQGLASVLLHYYICMTLKLKPIGALFSAIYYLLTFGAWSGMGFVVDGWQSTWAMVAGIVATVFLAFSFWNANTKDYPRLWWIYLFAQVLYGALFILGQEKYGVLGDVGVEALLYLFLTLSQIISIAIVLAAECRREQKRVREALSVVVAATSK